MLLVFYLAMLKKKLAFLDFLDLPHLVENFRLTPRCPETMGSGRKSPRQIPRFWICQAHMGGNLALLFRESILKSKTVNLSTSLMTLSITNYTKY